MPAALLIALPSGLVVSGVATWAVRLCNALAQAGRPAGLIVHATAHGARALAMPLHTGVQITDLSNLPPLDSAAGNLEPYLAPYQRAADALASHGPVVISPNLLGDCYALAANVVRLAPTSHRMVGWLHSDIPYEVHLQRHFEPLISRFIPVSLALEHSTIAAIPARRADVTRIAYGVDVPALLPPRTPTIGRALRLVYAGRLEHSPKRVVSLVHMSRALTARGIPHELVIIGEGPAARDLAEAATGLPAILRLSPQPPERILGLLASADIAVLPSRYEGLSISTIEAMSRGCVPVVARTNSGAAELLGHNQRGVIVDLADNATDEETGLALAQGVIDAALRLDELSVAAHAHAQSHLSIDAHAKTVATMLDEVAAAPPRSWPDTRPCAFAGAGHGSVPADGPDRLRALLEQLRGRRVLIHGTGRHTRELLGILVTSPAPLVAFADDDPNQHATTLLGLPIIAPANAAPSGATDVIISSWINHAAIWNRRGIYERQGLRVHALYDTPM